MTTRRPLSPLLTYSKRELQPAPIEMENYARKLALSILRSSFAPKYLTKWLHENEHETSIGLLFSLGRFSLDQVFVGQ